MQFQVTTHHGYDAILCFATCNSLAVSCSWYCRLFLYHEGNVSHSGDDQTGSKGPKGTKRNQKEAKGIKTAIPMPVELCMHTWQNICICHLCILATDIYMRVSLSIRSVIPCSMKRYEESCWQSLLFTFNTSTFSPEVCVTVSWRDVLGDAKSRWSEAF